MRFDFVWLAILDVNSAAVGHAPGFARGEVFVGVCQTLVEFFLVFVLLSIRIGIALVPKDSDKLLPFVIGLKLVPGCAFRRRKNRGDVVDPIRVSLFRFRLYLSWLFFWMPVSFLSQASKGGNSNEQ